MDLNDFKTKYAWGRKAPKPDAKPKAPRKRGSNPPGARTRNEPPRVFMRDEITDVRWDYIRPGAKPLEDTPALRAKVEDALFEIALAHQMYHEAVVKFQAIGQLPHSVIETIKLRQRRYLKLYKQ